MINIEKFLRHVPNYERFYTVDEMYAATKKVALEHPSLASYHKVGNSTDGEPIPMLKIGDGPKRMLLFACPHPNEPIGAMLIQFLFKELITTPELRKGYTWFLLPCVDPDGTRLNEGWFNGPFTVQNYAKHFYRPRSVEQVEWTFPITYKDLNFQSPMPETQALMNAFKQAKPHFVYSLHNAGFGGVYYYISHDLKDVYPDFHSIPESRDLFLSLGEPEMPWAQEFAPAVYKMPSIKDTYDYYETYSSQSPSDLIQGGASSYDFLQKHGNPVILITELPYFQAAQIADRSPLSRTRGEIILEGIQNAHDMVSALRNLLTEVAPLMSLDTRFYRTVVSFVELIENGLPSKAAWAQKADGMDNPATVAQKVDELYIGGFYRLLVASMLRRAIDAQLDATPSGALKTIRNRLEVLLEKWTDHIESHLTYSAIPIKKLVEVQYGALLAILNSQAFINLEQ
jgi:hypothetical protein